MKYNFKDIMLDIAGYSMIGLSIWKLFTIEEMTIQKALPYLLISAVGVVFVAFTIKKIATKVWDQANKYVKKKFNNEESNN